MCTVEMCFWRHDFLVCAQLWMMFSCRDGIMFWICKYVQYYGQNFRGRKSIYPTVTCILLKYSYVTFHLFSPYSY